MFRHHLPGEQMPWSIINQVDLIMMLLELQQFDTAMEYEAGQLGDDYSQPRSWYESWSSELGPWSGKGGASTETPAE